MPQPKKSHSIRYPTQGSPPGPSRTSTGFSVKRAITMTATKEPHPGYVQVTVKAYNLRWKRFRQWLVDEKFKNYPELSSTLVTESNVQWIQDQIRLWLPKDLTDDDHAEIDKLRDKPQIVRHDRSTPDPDVSDDD